MPELPEVEMARRFVEENLMGHPVTCLEVLDEKMLVCGCERAMRDAFLGMAVGRPHRHGKHLLVRIGEDYLYIHLGMSGSLHLLGSGESTKHTRFRMCLDMGDLVLDDPRRFGRFGVYHRIGDLIDERGLGPDALTVPDRVFASRMTGRRGSIKPLLLDQGVISGVGNLYADEALFQEGIHPATRADKISGEDLTRLAERVRKILETSIGVGTDFSSLPEGYLLRDRREGAPCPRCATGLVAIRLGGRTTVMCPSCQALH